MKVIDLPLIGLKIIELDCYNDARGYFYEQFQIDKFIAADLPHEFRQDNLSMSVPNVVRGLHFQSKMPQGKLVSVIAGTIWDVAVDLRNDSPSFGQHYAVTLSASTPRLFWIPPGFAHGFCVMGNAPAYVSYKVDQIYNPQGDLGIVWNDSQLKIDWPVTDPILSSKDLKLMSFEEYKSDKSLLSIWE